MLFLQCPRFHVPRPFRQRGFPYQNSYYNTVDLNDNWLRSKKATDLANQQGSKILCLWGSNSPQEKQINNQKVISYIDQVQQDMH